MGGSPHQGFACSCISSIRHGGSACTRNDRCVLFRSCTRLRRAPVFAGWELRNVRGKERFFHQAQSPRHSHVPAYRGRRSTGQTVAAGSGSWGVPSPRSNGARCLSHGLVDTIQRMESDAEIGYQIGQFRGSPKFRDASTKLSAG